MTKTQIAKYLSDMKKAIKIAEAKLETAKLN
jgi:hypothetical protein